MQDERDEAAALLRVRGLYKSYAVPVLTDIDLDVRAGEAHALVGANGAGKSTFSRIVSGLTDADAGAMWFDGQPYAPASKAEAEAHGVQMVMQELNLIRTLSIAENLFFNRLPRRFGFVDYDALHRQTHKALATVGLDGLDPDRPVYSLGVGHQQLVEIAAALARPCRLLILDEPTAALTDPEIELLFDNVRRLKAQGVAIIYISHRMEEILTMCDRVTVLRDGNVVSTRSTTSVTIDEIVQQMVGRETVEAMDEHPGRTPGAIALKVEGLRRGSEVVDVSFDVHHGEILGLAGLVGSGRTETLRAIFGADRRDAGVIRRGPHTPPLRINSPRDAVRAGIGMVPEDRKQQGLLLPLSIRVNTTLPRIPTGRIGGWISSATEEETAERYSDRLDLQRNSVEQPVETLSGGNQQKVVMARWLLRDCDVLLFDEPTRGIDVGAKQTVYHLLNSLVEQGKALVVVSSELRELMAICDRIAVLSAGHLVATFRRGEWTEEAIVAASFSKHLGTNAA